MQTMLRRRKTSTTVYPAYIMDAWRSSRRDGFCGRWASGLADTTSGALIQAKHNAPGDDQRDHRCGV
ncbi:hypothetical protein IG631_17007 [Alternaria alternata]|nr:hypothetical protein IG631_17007 [Alternaria alternata]